MDLLRILKKEIKDKNNNEKISLVICLTSALDVLFSIFLLNFLCERSDELWVKRKKKFRCINNKNRISTEVLIFILLFSLPD
jgi:hypothetical protein